MENLLSLEEITKKSDPLPQRIARLRANIRRLKITKAEKQALERDLDWLDYVYGLCSAPASYTRKVTIYFNGHMMWIGDVPMSTQSRKAIKSAIASSIGSTVKNMLDKYSIDKPQEK